MLKINRMKTIQYLFVLITQTQYNQKTFVKWINNDIFKILPTHRYQRYY